jgi:hypothetical protein
MRVVPLDLIFNVDEKGCSEHGDRREVKVIVPLEHPDPSLYLLFDRHAKLSTLTASIAPEGFGLKPLMIVHRLTAERELKYDRYDDSNIILSDQTNAFMTGALFEVWESTVFFPTIDARRSQFA